MFRKLISILVVLLFAFSAKAQFTSAGTEFYFALLQNRIDQNGAPTNCLLHEINIAFYIANNTNQSANIEIDFYGNNINYKIDGNIITTGAASNSYQFTLLPDEAKQIIALPTTTVTYIDPCPGASSTTTPDMRELMLMNNGVISSKVYVVKSLNNIDVAVYAESFQHGGRDASLILPLQSLGYSYYVASVFPDPLEFATVHYGQNLGGPSEIGIVATYDNSVINFKLPPQVTSAMAATSNVDATSNNTINGGTIHTITLNKGEAYQIQSDNFDLTGTNIWGNFPFAVFSGNMAASIISVPNYINGYDYVFEQMFPVKNWGSEYIITPLNDNQNDVVKIIALNDNTEVFKNGTSIGIIDAGENIEIQVLPMESMFISANILEIMIAQFTKSSYYANNSHQMYDPSMTIIPAIDQSIKEITFSVLPELNYSNIYCNNNVKTDFVNITAHSTETAQLMINDFVNPPVLVQNFNNIALAWTTVTGNPDYSYCILNVSNNSTTQSIPYHLYFSGQSNYGFNAIVYGLDCAESYSYAAGISIIIDTLANDTLVTNFSFTDSLCEGELCEFLSSSNLSLDSAIWSFDDPVSGAENYSSDQNPNHTFSNAGSYSVEFTAYSGNLSNTVTHIINVNPVPVIDIGQDTLFVNSFPADIYVSCQGCDYLWSTGSNDTLITVYDNGTYWVSATNVYNCSNSDTIVVIKNNRIDNLSGLESIAVFPNPFSNTLTIKYNERYSVLLTDINGRSILIRSNLTNSNILNLNELMQGLYFLKITTEKQTIVKKIVKINELNLNR